MTDEILKEMITTNNSKIVMLVMDGLGGIPENKGGPTELEAAQTPNMDNLAQTSSCGLLDPVSPGITPGSGPSHLALFGYEPLKYNIGRGVLSALGIDFPIEHGDLCARINFATIDDNGNVTDRRAGRISTELNKELCELISKQVTPPENIDFFIRTEKEHRAALILRGKDLSDAICDTDPQETGVKLPSVKPHDPEGTATANILNNIVSQILDLLKDKHPANAILLRGFAKYHSYPTIYDRFKLKSAAIAEYPMYRGLAKLVGMEILESPVGIEEEINLLQKYFNDYDFFYVHIKKTDSYGEDGNFGSKVHVIEETDKIIPQILDLNPDVLAITADHSTPAKLKSHSWHPVPLLLHSKYCRQDKFDRFDELTCRCGSISRLTSVYLMPIMLSNCLRLKKFGA